MLLLQKKSAYFSRCRPSQFILLKMALDRRIHVVALLILLTQGKEHLTQHLSQSLFTCSRRTLDLQTHTHPSW